MRCCLIAPARVRQTTVGSSCVPKTAISSGATPPWRSVAYAARAARPLPTIAQRMVQPKVHGMRPEEGTRRLAPLLDPRPVGIRPQKVVPGLLGKIAFGRGMRLDPREARAGILDPGLVDVRKSEHRGQEQPLTAAVVAVLEVTVDTPVDEERLLDPLDELGRADEKQRPV